MKEEELRRNLDSLAGEMRVPVEAPDGVLRRARRRMAFSGLAVSIGGVGAVAALVLGVVSITGPTTRRVPPSDGTETEADFDHGAIALSVAPSSLAAADGRVWVMGSHDLELVDIATHLVVDRFRIEKTFSSAVADGDKVWAVGGGDGGDPQGELLSFQADPLRLVERTPLGQSPYDLLRIGSNLWVADISGDSLIRVSRDGTAKTFPDVGTAPIALASSEGRLWLVSSGSGDAIWEEIDTGSGEIINGPFPAGRCPTDIAIAQGLVWVVDYCKGRMLAYDQSGAEAGRVPLGPKPGDLVYGGGFLWVGSSDGKMYQVDPESFQVLKEYDLKTNPGQSGSAVVDIEVVDRTVWVASQAGGWWLEWFEF